MRAWSSKKNGFEFDVMLKNIFELDFAQPQKQRLQLIKCYKGIGFFFKESLEFLCPVCNAKVMKSQITCSENCRGEYARRQRIRRKKAYAIKQYHNYPRGFYSGRKTEVLSKNLKGCVKPS